MKALVLGTSNSILRDGWVEGLRESFDGEIVNRSAGANCVAYVLYELSAMDEEAGNFDFVFLDSVVNDEHFIDRGFFNREWLQVYLREIYRRLEGRVVVDVGFSSQKFFQDLDSSVAEYHRRAASRYGAYYVSVKSLLNKYVLHTGVGTDIDDFYEDPGHIHRAISKRLGFAMGQMLNKGVFKNKMKMIKDEGGEFDFVKYTPASDDVNSSVEMTSLRTEELHEFGEGGYITISKKPCMVHGMFVNARMSNACITIKGCNGEQETRSLVYNTSGGKMQMKFVHFSPPICTKDDLYVTSGSVHGNRFVVSIHAKRELMDGPVVLNLAGLLVSNCASPEDGEFPESEIGADARLISEMVEEEMLKRIEIGSVIENGELKKTYPRSWIEL